MDQVEVLAIPVKSEGDKKNYRLIRLSNGLKALLISKKDDEGLTKSEEIAAACLAVKVGSFDDPRNAMGLAHFLEHILFMGSEKYPKENSFNDFLVANGGNDNASTTGDCTKFFFNVADKAFPTALDIFANQFISPLLLKNSMQREREAVDSEYQQASSENQILIEYIYKSLMADSHPASQFEVGNLRTLKENISDDDLHEELLKLFSKYVANKMSLAVQSKRSLDELQTLVVSIFSPLKASSSEIDEKIELSVDEIFKPEFFDKIYFVKPKNAKKALHLCWALPSVQKHYKTSPLAYVANIFTNEREGGISNYLREQKWMTSLQCYTHIRGFGGNSHYCMPRLTIGLTDLGFEHLNEVLSSIFSYLLMIKESPVEEHRRVFNDIKAEQETVFRFQREQPASTNVKNAANSMMMFEDSDILLSTPIYKEFNENVITDVINSMNQRKFNILILDNDRESYDMKEEYFGTEYDQQDYPDEYKKLWGERKLNPIFYLEKPNPFKATNFEIFENDEESTKYPVKVLDDPVYEVWHKLDQTFKKPNCVVNVYMLSPKQMTSIQSYLFLSIYNSMLARHLKKITSEAKNAGLILSTNNELKALSLSFAGFNVKMEVFIQMVMKEMKTFNDVMDQSTFDLIKNQFKKNYRNSLLKEKFLNDELFYKTLRQVYYTDFELHNEIDNVSFESFQKFVQTFFSSLKVQVLVSGNLTKAHALRIVSILQTYVSCEPLDEEFELTSRNYALPDGSNVLRAKSLMLNDDNSYTNIFYQCVDESLRARNLCQLIASILDPKAFNYLRSQNQLGYVVGTRYLQKHRVHGLVIYVASQERKHLHLEVQSQMEIFMNEIARKTIENLSDEDFETFKESRVKSLSADFSSIQDEANANWKEITQQDYVFDRYELAANVTRSLTKDDLQKFFTSITEENVRKLCIAVIGNKDQQNENDKLVQQREPILQLITENLQENENVITNLEDFRSRLVLQPVLKFSIQ